MYDDYQKTDDRDCPTCRAAGRPQRLTVCRPDKWANAAWAAEEEKALGGGR